VVMCVCVAFCVERCAGLQCARRSVWRGVLDCCVRDVLCGEVCWTAVCVAFFVERCAGLQCAWRCVWRGMLDCSVRGVLCGEVCCGGYLW
jgi:hypothetical protein